MLEFPQQNLPSNDNNVGGLVGVFLRQVIVHCRKFTLSCYP
jgi:hypothetical protein